MKGIKFRRQHGIGPYIVDFYCPEQSLVVEVDGDSHADAEQIQKDQRRDRYLQSIGLKVVRYRNDDIMKNLDGVLEDLQTRVSSGTTSPRPSLSRRGEEEADQLKADR
jgi:very-short-patch-repair endonuclease